MSTVPSPPARRLGSARWLDPRLLIGVLLVVVAVSIGAKVVSDAQGGELVWAATRDLPVGTTLREDDLEPRSVRLDRAVSAYVDASGPVPDGYVVVRSVGAGELLPADAVRGGATPDANRLVSVPVEANHYPGGLARGQRVDVYVVRGGEAGAAGGAAEPEPTLVLEDVSVADVVGGAGGLGSATSTVGIVLSVPPADVADVVQAVAIGSIQLVLIPNQAP